MNSEIIIELINFRCWSNKTIRLTQGINLFTGKSGSGKSTICKAIYFVLYGGRKFKDLQNRKNKTGTVRVSFHFISNNLEYEIVRTRPSENVVIQIKDNTGLYKLEGLAAQSWIDSNYGVENIWLSSSFISRKKSHFLLDAVNSDKMDLLQRISFGDLSTHNQPEYYLNIAKNSISSYNDFLKKYNESLKIQQSIRYSIFSRNSFLSNTPFISIEDMEKMIEDRKEEIKNLDILKTSFISIKSTRHLNSQLLSLPTYDFDINEIDSKIERLNLMRDKFNLSIKLKDFDSKILELDRKIIENDNFLYEKYISEGWIINEDINEFISKKKKELSSYKLQNNLENKNLKIIEDNLKTDSVNIALKKAYDRQMNDYNNIKAEIESYHLKKLDLDEKINIIENETYIKLDSDDDLTSNWLVAFKIGLNMGLKELICPNCNHGLIYQDGILILGTIENGNCENLKRKINEKLSLIDIEFDKRKKRENVMLESQKFSQKTLRELPDLPDEPKYYEKEKLLSVKSIKKPTLEIFDVPVFSYEELVSLYKSIGFIESYEKFNQIEITIDLSIDEINTQIKELMELKKLIIDNNEVKNRIESLLSTLLPDDSEIESKIEISTNKINEYSLMINIANEMREIEKVDSNIEELNESIKTCISNISSLEYYYNQVEELGVSSLQEKIEEVNAPLGIILDDLFEEPIDFKLTSYKELKNGNTKLQVNFVVDYKGMPVSNLDDFSDGEEGRLSLALLMAFSRMNNNPFIIIDEVLSSMDDELRVDSIDIINKWTPGKFVIHICHSVAEGHHYNVVNFDKDDQV